MNTSSTPGNTAAETPPAWDAILVRELLREAQSSGRHPALLELGRRQTAAFRRFLAEAYGDEGAITAKVTYYLGLKVVAVDAESHLAVAGTKAHDAWDGDLPPRWTDASDQAA